MEEKNVQSRPAVILGMSANGLSVARSLGRKRIPLIGIDRSSKAPGMASKYLRKKIIAPDFKNENEFVEFLKSLTHGMNVKPVLFPTADEYVFIISKYRNELSGVYEFLISSEKDVDCFLDKRKTYEFCVDHNIPHPNTYFIDKEDFFNKIVKDINFPCIVKPQDSHLWRQTFDEKKAFVIRAVEDLKEKYDKVSKLSLKIVIQKIVSGPDSDIYQYLSYRNKDGVELASFVCRKLRQYPPHFGIACLCESVHEPLIIEEGRRLLNHLSYKGIVALEFKINSENNRPVFLEANLRTSFFGELAVASGVDFPYLIYKNLVYQDNQVQQSNFKEGVKLWNIKLDLGCFSRLKKTNEITFWAWLKELKAKKIAHTYFAWDDLWPWFVVYARMARMAFSKLFKAVLKRNKNGKK